jgi:tRNA(fMet)-specific endonuclease VapC
LDTDIVIAFSRRDQASKNKIEELENLGVELAITSITLCELYRGAFLSMKVEESLAFINEFLERVTLLQQNKDSCLLYGKDFAELKKKGMLTQVMDLMIASISKANNYILVTRNVKDFRNIPDLVVNAW